MLTSDRTQNAADTYVWVIVVAITFGIVLLSVSAVATGIRDRQLGYVLIGASLLLSAPGYYYWRHPTKPWRPGWHTVLGGVGLIMFGFAVFLLRSAP